MPTYGVNAIPSSIPPWAVNQRIGTAAARYALNSMLMPRTDSGLTYTDYRSGVLASGDGGTTHLAMQVNPTGGMGLTVNQGNAIVNTANQGAYMCCLDQQRTIEIPASSGSTNRKDIVVARVYDDNNSALSGAFGVRQFTVEIVQGDATTGDANVPSLPTGAIPLAEIDVPEGTNTIAANQIIDRRGPGIVARGGMRALYGADAQPGSEAYDQPGAYPGDQRWVHTEGFQHQVYYGEHEDPHRGRWRGVHNALVYNARPPTSLNGSWIFRTGSTRELCRVKIPYPGTPFMVYPTGQVYGELSSFTAGDAFIAINSHTGSVINASRRDSGSRVEGSAGDTRQGWEIAPVMWGPFMDATDIVLCQRVWYSAVSGGGVGFRHTPADHSLLSVVVYPSTVQPPKWTEQ